MIKVNGHEVKFEKFPNGETNLIHSSINLGSGMAITDVHFKYESDASLIELLFVKSYLDIHCKSDKINLTIYYIPYSRMDRVEGKSAFTLKYITNMINNMKFNKIVVIEPHSNVSTALLDNAEAKFINYDLLPVVMKEVGFDNDFDYIVFPDSGAMSRYKGIGSQCTIVGHKERDFETGNITGLELIGINNKVGKKAIIVDDLSSYGGTFIATARELKKKFNIDEVYLLVAHAENSIFKGQLFEHIDKVFTTDSILSEHNYWRSKKYQSQLQVFDIEGVIKCL